MNEKIKVKIRTTVITQRYGTLSTGDILTTDPAFAKHLVEEANAADYLDEPKAAETEQPPKAPKAKKPASPEPAEPVAEQTDPTAATE